MTALARTTARLTAALVVAAMVVPGAAAADPFTVVVIPDSGNALYEVPQVWMSEMAWLTAHAAALDTAFVIHVGDLVQHNTADEWALALDGLDDIEGVIPYSVLPGNHDMGDNGSADTRDTTLFNATFPLARLSALPHFGGSFPPGDTDNTYHYFSAGGRDWLVLSLEFGPRDEVVAWANDVLAAHQDRLVIIATHTHVYSDDLHHGADPDHLWRPQDYGIADDPGGVHDGLQLWHQLVKLHSNVVMVVNGHVLNDGLGRRDDLGTHGNRIHQLLANYQQAPMRGGGNLRLMRFDPDVETITVQTYSTWFGESLDDPDNSFVLPWDPDDTAAGRPTILADGFESGDLVAWTSASP